MFLVRLGGRKTRDFVVEVNGRGRSQTSDHPDLEGFGQALPLMFYNIVPDQDVGIADREALVFEHRERLNGVFAPRH